MQEGGELNNPSHEIELYEQHGRLCVNNDLLVTSMSKRASSAGDSSFENIKWAP